MMAVAQSEAHIDRLPDELLLEIITQPILSATDLISMARTSRRHYNVTISVAYKVHVKNQRGLASKCRAMNAPTKHDSTILC